MLLTHVEGMEEQSNREDRRECEETYSELEISRISIVEV